MKRLNRKDYIETIYQEKFFMAKLSLIWRTLIVTHNPFIILSLRRENVRKSVIFRNGMTFRLTMPQYRALRDSYPLIRNWSVTQLEDDLFELDNGRSKVVCAAWLVPLFCEIMAEFVIQQERENLFHLKNEKLELIGSEGMLFVIQEQGRGEYENDYQGKVVLDIGGFEGESAAYFWLKGAKKVIIYEPVPENVEMIKKNVALNGINAEIHEAGIATGDGTQIIMYDKIHPGLGLKSEGKNSIEIKTKSLSKIIDESHADIAKIDCEGAERSLVTVPSEILQKIPDYMIEVHSLDIRTAVLHKLRDSGFSLVREIPISITSHISVLSLKKSS